jgi:uncharacterized protein (TIGR00251 family)
VAVSTSPLSETRISLHVYPNAPRNQVVGFEGGVLAVRVAAAPVKGQANRELVAFLSQLLGISKGRLAIIRGHASRNKLISVRDLSKEEVLRRLLPA